MPTVRRPRARFAAPPIAAAPSEASDPPGGGPERLFVEDRS